MHNCESYSTFSSIGSDRNAVTLKIKLILIACKAVLVRANYEWASPKNLDLSDLYTVTVKNQYARLRPESESVTEKYVQLIRANQEASKGLLPVKKKSKKTDIC